MYSNKTSFTKREVAGFGCNLLTPGLHGSQKVLVITGSVSQMLEDG